MGRHDLTASVKKMGMTLTEADAAKLRESYGIYFFPKLHGQMLVQGGGNLLEKFSQHLPAKFMPLGAYSYSRSFFSHVQRIGRYCSIGENVTVMGHRHPTDWVSSSPVFYRRKRARSWGSQRELFPEFEDFGPQIVIGDDVWIGDDVLLGHGVTIGTGSVIAARSVVTHDIAPYSIVAGTPARVIRLRFPEDVCTRLLTSRWWDWPVSAWDETDPRIVDAFLERAAEVREMLPCLLEVRFTPKQLLNSIKE